MYIINSTFLRTTNGTMDAETTSGQRIGDKITLSVVSFKMILELNERYSYFTFRMMLVRSARGDTPTGTTLWEGNSGNKMLDNFKTERYSILFTKYVKMKAPNMSLVASGAQAVGSGYTFMNSGGNDVQMQSHATRIVKFYIPGRKFSRNGVLQYENGTNLVKFFDYHFIIYVYSNYSTVDAGGIAYNVGRLNKCFIKKKKTKNRCVRRCS